MTKGMMKTSFIALVMAAGLTSAQAADLGGNCCADLEERIAELEATTARKGTRKTSLTIYGWVNRMMLHWDDGVQSNNYLGIDNTNASTRFGFRGDAAINSEWKAGYSIVVDVANGARSFAVNQNNEDGGTSAASTADDHALRLRDANFFLESSRIGRFTMGRLTHAGPQGTIDLAGIANVASSSPSLIGGGFVFRNAAGQFAGVSNAAANVQGTSIAAAALVGNNLSLSSVSDLGSDSGYRIDGIKWDSPTWHGFVIGASIGEARETDRTSGLVPAVNPNLGPVYAVNLRYAGEFNGVRVASAIGYEASRNDELGNAINGRANAVNWGSSSSLLHVATGLFLQGHYLVQERGNDAANVAVVGASNEAKSWLVQAGLQRNFFGIGNTVLYGEVGRSKNALATFVQTETAVLPTSELSYWGLGITQNIDAAAMQLYAGYRQYSLDHNLAGVNTSFKDLGLLSVGARINF